MNHSGDKDDFGTETQQHINNEVHWISHGSKGLLQVIYESELSPAPRLKNR